MVKVDTKTMWIYLTRGDSAIIVFSAENEGGGTFPSIKWR